MFTPYIISKEHVEPRISELGERKKSRQQNKIKKCYQRQETDLTTASDLSAISSTTLFTPYIVSKEHTQPIMAELEEERAQRRSKRTKKPAPRLMNASSVPKQTRFAPYITSNRHVAASLAERKQKL